MKDIASARSFYSKPDIIISTMLSSDDLEKRVATFPMRYWRNFDYVWKWKIKVETNSSAHILDENNRKEAYAKLCNILPKWQTYRNGDNFESLKTLENALSNIAEEYNQLRNCTLLEFDKIPIELLAEIWHELGRVKEKNGSRNENGCYSAIAVTKPLLLMWGQTPAFDSNVRKHMAQSYSIPKYSCKWSLDDWIRTMKQLSETLKTNVRLVEFMKEETIRRYGERTTVPYGRYIDVYYWKGP